MALSPNRWWYQQRSTEGWWSCGLGEQLRKGLGVFETRNLTSFFRPAISLRSWSISATSWGELTPETGDAATSVIPSTSWARSSRDNMSPVEAKTIRTLAGRRWRKSSQRRDLSTARPFRQGVAASCAAVGSVCDCPAPLQ